MTKNKRKAKKIRRKVIIRKRSFSPSEFLGMDKSFTNFRELCKGCGICLEVCPKHCIKWSKELGVYKVPAVDCEIEKCIACKICENACPDSAIKIDNFQKADEKLLAEPKRKKLLR